MTRTRIAIIAAGGNAREIAAIVRDVTDAGQGNFAFVGYVVSDLEAIGPPDSQHEVLGDFQCIGSSPVDALAMGCADPETRLRLSVQLCQHAPNINWPVLVHPSALVDRSTVQLGRGVVVCVGIIMTVNVRIGDFSQLNFGCTVGHEAHIGRGCLINPGANTSRGVILEDGVMIGTGATGATVFTNWQGC